MVIFKVNKGMSKKEYLDYSKHIVQEYEYCKGQDKCMVVPEYVDVFIVDDPATPLVIDKPTTEDLDRALKKLYEKPDKIYFLEELRRDLPEVKNEQCLIRFDKQWLVCKTSR